MINERGDLPLCVSLENAPGARLAWLEENIQKLCTEVVRRPSLMLEEQLVTLAADRSPEVSGQRVRAGVASQRFGIQWASREILKHRQGPLRRAF